MPAGSRFRWKIDEVDVDSFDGPIGGRGPKRSERRLDRLERIVSELVSKPSEVAAGTASDWSELRSRVIALEEALIHAQDAAAAQGRADDERSALIGHLLEAVAAGDRADEFRRIAIGRLEEAAAAARRPQRLPEAGGWS